MPTTEDWIVITNMLVALTSILVAAATEHEAIGAMKDTVINVLRTLAQHPKMAEQIEEGEKNDDHH